MADNFHPQIESNRRRLYPILKTAKRTPGVTKAYLTKDRLTINSATFTVNSLHLLPDNLKPEKLSQAEDDNTLLFWGRDSTFSNFHPSPFQINGKHYNCVEQYFCAKKATTFKVDSTAEAIMKETDPARQKRLGNQVNNFQTPVWNNVMEQVMEEGLHAKFTQNAALKKKLLSTRGKLIGEAAPVDKVWGTGCKLCSKDVLKSNLWQGKNLLGKLLMKVRDSL